MKRSRGFALALLLPLAGACAPIDPEFGTVTASPPPDTAQVAATPAPAEDTADVVVTPAPEDTALAPDAMTLTAASVAGEYTLIGYGDMPLPFTVEREELQNCTEEVIEGSLTLQADGTWSYTYVERDTCPDEVQTETESVGGEFEIRDGRLHFDEEWGEDGPEGEGMTEARDFEVGWFEDGRLHIQPEGIQGIWLVFQR